MKPPIKLIAAAVAGILFTQSSAQATKNRQAAWQQRVNYDISVLLDDENHMLHGFEKMEYVNNSPDALTEIWLHLWPNAYADVNTPLSKQLVRNGKLDHYYAKESELGWIDSLRFTVNGEPTELKAGLSSDVAYLKLNKPLQPGEYAILRTPFRVHIPKCFSRLGYSDSSYQITQWYPKPAVYDVNGWNPMPYLDQGEFYSEFGTYNVQIELPEKYVLAATGDLISTKTDVSSGINRYHYREQQVHDFAWFADTRFKIDSGLCTLPSGRRVQCIMYYQKEKDNAIKTIIETMEYMSKMVGEYPYNTAKVVIGPLFAGGGMEYPTIAICNNGDPTVVEHEVGHNWFYGILGSNERNFAWMDEGLNSFYESRFKDRSRDKFTQQNSLMSALENKVRWFNAESLTGFKYNSSMFQHHLLFQYSQRSNQDQPINLSSDEFSPLNYAAIVYGKSALVFNYLKHYLGTNVFDTCISRYFQTWKFRHPLPGDIEDVFSITSGKNLDWFFDGLIGSNQILDYKIIAHKHYKESNSDSIFIKNTGSLAAPLFLGLYKGEKWTLVTVEGFNGIKAIASPFTAERYRIDPYGIMPEFFRTNNTLRANGAFKKFEKIRLTFAGNLENPGFSNIFWLPTLGFNRYDGLLMGASFYNEAIPEKKISWTAAPMFGLSSHALAGYAQLAYRINFRGEQTRQLEMKLSASQFSYNNAEVIVGGTVDSGRRLTNLVYDKSVEGYKKLQTEIIVHVNQSPGSHKTSKFIARNLHVWEATPHISFPDGRNLIRQVYFPRNNYFEALLINNNRRAINPVKTVLGIRLHKKFQLLFAEIEGGINLFGKKKKLNYRFYAGGLMKNDRFADPESISRYWMYASGNSGKQDYTYQYALPGRNEGNNPGNNLWSQQIIPLSGGLKVPAHFGYASDTWLTALNMNIPAPGKVPASLYFDICFLNSLEYDAALKIFNRKPVFLYNLGLSLQLIPDILSIHFPVACSAQIRNALFFRDLNYAKKISFTLRLEKLNPHLLKHLISDQI